MTTRVSDFGQNALTQYQMMQLETQVSNLQAQIGSGQTSQTFDGIAPNAQRLVNLQADNSNVTQYLADTNLATQRLTSQQNTVTSLLSLATNVQTLLVNASNSNNASSVALNQSAQSQLQEVAGLLNTQFEGQYLFSGTASNTPPVNLSAPGFSPPGNTYPSTPDTAYYQGNNTSLSVQADDNFNVQYGASANAPGFEELIRALNLAATTDTVSGQVDTQRLQEALGVIKQSISDITNVQATLGVQQSVLSNTQTTQNQVQLQLQQNVGDIQNVDVAQVATSLSAAQNNLESSFAVTARLSQLSLINFLPVP
ncbi:MAG TPA: flagellin [Alphaproteobacteria bacterium]|nr:flagellin [Alphaproteobacteria bacterium]